MQMQMQMQEKEKEKKSAPKKYTVCGNEVEKEGNPH